MRSLKINLLPETKCLTLVQNTPEKLLFSRQQRKMRSRFQLIKTKAIQVFLTSQTKGMKGNIKEKKQLK